MNESFIESESFQMTNLKMNVQRFYIKNNCVAILVENLNLKTKLEQILKFTKDLQVLPKKGTFMKNLTTYDTNEIKLPLKKKESINL